MKQHIEGLVLILKPVMLSIIQLMQKGNVSALDQFALITSAQLLRMLYEHFGQNEWIEKAKWEVDVDWTSLQ